MTADKIVYCSSEVAFDATKSRTKKLLDSLRSLEE